MTTARLQVDRVELLQALFSVFRLQKASSKAKAVLHFEDGALHFELPGMSVGVSAAGEWSGRAQVPAAFLQMLTRVPPDTDPVSFVVAEGKLRVNSSVISCTWTPDSGSRIELPLNPPFKMVLSAAYHYTPDDIEQAGLKDVIADAEKRRDALIGQALAALNEFGFTRAEIRALVDAKMRGTPRP